MGTSSLRLFGYAFPRLLLFSYLDALREATDD